MCKSDFHFLKYRIKKSKIQLAQATDITGNSIELVTFLDFLYNVLHLILLSSSISSANLVNYLQVNPVKIMETPETSIPES